MSRSDTEICRVTRSKAQAKASYDRLSRWYDAIVGWSEKKARETGLQKLAPVEGETVLEIGFGTGHCIQALAQSVGTSGKVHGVDISEGMMDITRQRLNRAKLSDRVELKCGDATNLPYESYSFDAVFMSFTLELFDTPEIPIVLQECQRVIRTDGRICVVSLSKERENWVTHAYEWLHRKIPSYADCRPIFVRKSLEDVGFQVVDVTHIAWWGFLCEIVLAKKP
jgi:demethylmenaquinone methyltransferase/2-methoxy-6-polyprenyl-1,4-benzoquinol methylase